MRFPSPVPEKANKVITARLATVSTVPYMYRSSSQLPIYGSLGFSNPRPVGAASSRQPLIVSRLVVSHTAITIKASQHAAWSNCRRTQAQRFDPIPALLPGIGFRVSLVFPPLRQALLVYESLLQLIHFSRSIKTNPAFSASVASYPIIRAETTPTPTSHSSDQLITAMSSLGISSTSPIVWHTSALLSLLPLAFGINAMVRPRSGFEIFEFEYPKAVKDRKLIDGLMLIYGIRDVFWGMSQIAAWYYGAREVLGWLMVAGSVVAFVDGVANKAVLGYGQGKHWGYAPVLTILGAVLLGAVDGM